MIRKAFSWILLVLVWSSCTEEEVVPRTNPRFSVAFAQSVDKSGAEFAATVFDFGSEEILEYGFVYGMQGNLSIERNNYVSEVGVPEKEFRLKSSHSMPFGKRITVVAFIKTESGVVYSQPYQFVSEGSDGFFLDRITMASEVFFGDTLRVFGRNLSRELTDYSVQIQKRPAIVIDLAKDSFGVIIPNALDFQEVVGPEQIIEMEIKVSDKTLIINQSFRFKQPVFSNASPKEVSYAQDLVIQGDYLLDNDVKVRYVNKSGQRFNLLLKSNSKNELVIGLNALFTEPNPILEFVIRGQTYPLSGFFKLKETKIDPGQTSSFRSFSGTVKIKGENFNPYLPEYNAFELSPNIFKVDILSVNENEMEIFYEYQLENLPGTRITELRMVNGGIPSSYPLSIEWTSPSIPHILTGDFSSTLLDGRTVAVGGKAYMINSLGIYEINPQTRGFTRIANSPTPGKNPAGIFAIQAEGKVFFATNDNGDVRMANKLFFVFDPQTKSVKSLPNIPSSDNSFQSIVFYQGSLYYQGDELDPLGQDGNIRRYKFGLATGTWEKLQDLNQPDGWFNTFPSFDYQGKTYSVSNYVREDNSYVSGLFLFNPSTFSWDFIGPVMGQELIESPQASFVIGDLVYLKGRAQIYVLNLKTRQVESPGYLSFYIDFASSPNHFQIGGKFYIFSGYAFWEYDPNYFF